MSSSSNRPGPGVRADYVRFLPVTLRWMDNDVFGHLNNVQYYSLFDTTVCEFLVGQRILAWPGDAQGGAEPCFMVVAESGCRFFSEMAFPDRMTAGLRAARLGARSVRWEVGVFRGDADVASAEGFMVHVCVDTANRRPAEMPARWRSAIETLQSNNERAGG